MKVLIGEKFPIEADYSKPTQFNTNMANPILTYTYKINSNLIQENTYLFMLE